MLKKAFLFLALASMVSLSVSAEESVAWQGGFSKSAVTLWGVFFNEPEDCSDGVCGEDDIFVDPVAPMTSVTFLAGQRTRAFGRLAFGASYGEGSTIGALPFPALGLFDADAAEVHLIIRTHGRYIPGIADEQITTFDGGCDVATCEDLQFAIFRPADADPSGKQTTKVFRFSDLGEVPGAWATIWRESDGIRVAIHSRLP